MILKEYSKFNYSMFFEQSRKQRVLAHGDGRNAYL